MRRLTLKIMAVISFFGIFSSCSNQDPSTWSSDKIDKWFEKGEWHKGWNAEADSTISKTTLARQYHKNKARWDKAFAFLKDNDLGTLEPKRYDLDGDSLFVMVSDYTTKNREDADFEAHRKYADIQYVAQGSEWIGIAPISSRDSVIQEYNLEKDTEFITVSEGSERMAIPGKFFVFFPENAHRPGLKDGENAPVRKIIVKVLLD